MKLDACPLDFEEMPALVPGHCNACGRKLSGRQKKTCSDACKAAWHRELTVLGRKVAERLLIVDQCQNTKTRHELKTRALSEARRLSRDWLARRRDYLALPESVRRIAQRVYGMDLSTQSGWTGNAPGANEGRSDG